MPTVTITAATPILTRAVTAICASEGYQATINGSPNPITPTEFFRQWIITQVKNRVRQHESNTAAATAATTAGADVDTNLILT